MKILIVEDTEPIARAFRKILENEGYDVDVAGDGRSALESLKQEAFDLLLVDLMLPGMSGQELIEALHAQRIRANIVVTTNMGVGYDEEHLMKLGVQRILLKSRIGPDELRAIAKEYSSP